MSRLSAHSIAALLLSCSLACGELVYNDPVTVISSGGNLNYSYVSWGDAAPTPIVTNGLLAWWKLNADYTDSFGSYPLVTVSTNGACRWDGGKDGIARHSIDMDGSDRLTATNGLNSVLDGATTFSLSAWVKKSSDGDVDEPFGSWQGSPQKRKIGWFISSDNKLYCSVSSDGLAPANPSSTGTITGTNWHHIGSAYNAGTVTFYLDGVVSGSGSTDASVYTHANPFCLGWWFGDTTAANSFEGNMDEVRVYSTAVSSNDFYTLAHEFD